MRAALKLATVALTIAAAAAIGFGVPLVWLWVGSQMQGDNGATTLSISVAMVVLFGIIITYLALLYLAGVVMARVGNHAAQRAAARTPWMRGMSESKHRSQHESMGGIERVFVVTAMIVAVLFWLWFAFKAGSPLPRQ